MSCTYLPQVKRSEVEHATLSRSLTSSRNCAKAFGPDCSLEEARTVLRMSLSIFRMESAYMGILEISDRCLRGMDPNERKSMHVKPKKMTPMTLQDARPRTSLTYDVVRRCLMEQVCRCRWLSVESTQRKSISMRVVANTKTTYVYGNKTRNYKPTLSWREPSTSWHTEKMEEQRVPLQNCLVTCEKTTHFLSIRNKCRKQCLAVCIIAGGRCCQSLGASVQQVMEAKHNAAAAQP